MRIMVEWKLGIIGSSDIECLGGKGSWANIASIGLVESRFEENGSVSTQQRFYLTQWLD